MGREAAPGSVATSLAQEAARVARYRLATTLRRRWGGYLAVVLLVGLVGGVSLASLQAARRTQAAYPTYLASIAAPQLTAAVYGAGGNPEPDRTAAIAHLAGVERLATAYVLHTVPLAANGAPRLALLDDLSFVASRDGLFTRTDRLVAVAGRLADPRRPDELVVDANAARLLGVHVGSVVPVGIFTAGHREVARRSLHVVGVVAESTDVVEDDVDRAYGFAYGTPALLREAIRLAPGPGNTPIFYALALARGTSLPTVERDLQRVLPAGAISEFHVTARTETAVELAVRPMSVALGAFGLIAALACLVLGAQAISRLLREDEEDRRVLRALGAARLSTVADVLCGIGVAVLLGTGAAIAVAVALSPLSPIGPVRPVYPDRGVAVDGPVYLVGAAVLVVALFAWAALAARRSLSPGPRGGVTRPSSVARAAEAAGMPVTCVVGIRFALEPGSGRTSVPLRSVLVGTVVAVALVCATLTFSSSLATLVSTPRLYGWNWSYALLPTNNLPRSSAATLDRDPLVAAWSGMDYNIATIDGLAVPVLMEPTADPAVAPPILSGHAVRAANQIVFGASTLAELHRHVGQSVEVGYGSPRTAPLYAAPVRLRIVGTATFPAIGYSSEIADHTSMGTGAIFSEAILPASFLGIVRSSDPNLAGPELAFVRLRAGVSAAAGRANLDRVAAGINRTYAADPDAAGNAVEVTGVLRPAQIVNYGTIGATPVALAVALAVGALAALALTLVASVRRRRRDLALMKALGFTPRQLAGAVTWQAAVAALIGIVLGVPLGIVLGRQLWILFAQGLNAVPDPTVPAAALAAVAVGTVGFAVLVALGPGRSAGRTPTAAVLRSD